MIDETIGSIGSTHGVSDSSRPATKKAPTIGQNEPPRSTASTPETSTAARRRRRRSWLAALVPAAPGEASPDASIRAVPAPPKATRPIAAVLCIGG